MIDLILLLYYQISNTKCEINIFGNCYNSNIINSYSIFDGELIIIIILIIINVLKYL